MSSCSFFIFVSVFVVFLSSISCAPRSKNSRGSSSPQTVYDQKQTGEVNIQVRLKDFEIIALLTDDNNSSGDYDYSYDYLDFTAKPATEKPPDKPTDISPASLTSTTTSTEQPSSTSSSHPYPIISPSTTARPIEEPLVNKLQAVTATNNLNTSDTNYNIIANTIKEAVLAEVSKTSTTINEPTSSGPVSSGAQTSTTTPRSIRLEEPGKIKVQIIEMPISSGKVPDEEVQEQSGTGEVSPQGEILQKKCATGFTRDKRGRCRRVRKPAPSAATSQLLGFTRLASNWASRLQGQTSSDGSFSVEST